MALHDVLTALRELILDQAPLAGPVEERRLALKQRFGHLQLTYEEISDLAAIEPSRMNIYTELVFAGEREMLRWVFPMTLAAIRRLAPYGAEDAAVFDFELTRELHRFRPWQRPSVRLLAMNFQAFINECRTEWLAGWEGLRELIDYERTDLEVYYAWDPDHRPFSVEELQALANLSVEALMSVGVLMPRHVALRRYRRDLHEWAAHWHSHQELPADIEPGDPVFLACGRAIETLHTYWQRLEEYEFRLLLNIPRETPVTVNDLATAYLSGQPEGSDETALFSAFFGRLIEWMRGGLLVHPRTDQESHAGTD